VNQDYYRSTNFALVAPRLNQLIAAISEVAQVMPATAAHAAITAVVMGSILRRARVTHDGRRWQPLVQFLMLVSKSGTGKSALSLVLRALREFDRKALTQSADATAEFEAALEEWRLEKRRLKRAAARDAAAMGALREHLLKQPTLKHHPRVLIEGATYGAIVDRVEFGGPHLLLSDEVATLKKSGLMSDGRFAPFFSGDPVVDDTRSSGTVVALNPRLVLSAALQPSELRRWQEASDGSLRGSGALARFLLMHAAPNYGWRDFSRDNLAAQGVIDDCNRWIHSQLDIFVSQGNDAQFDHHFSTEALAVFRDWQRTLELRQQPWGALSAVPDSASKAADQAIRLAASVEWFEKGRTEVSSAAVLAAIYVVELSLDFHGQLFGPDAGASILEQWAPRTLAWLRPQFFAPWQTRPMSVLKTGCPHEVCPERLWKPVIDQLAHEGMLRVAKGLIALTPMGLGLVAFEMPLVAASPVANREAQKPDLGSTA